MSLCERLFNICIQECCSISQHSNQVGNVLVNIGGYRSTGARG